jgi:hypothetical protein
MMKIVNNLITACFSMQDYFFYSHINISQKTSTLQTTLAHILVNKSIDFVQFCLRLASEIISIPYPRFLCVLFF